ncbi:hypothetical protein JHK86_007915 [Glycine max]|nr:hypothetical protein JHK86_007915 [Glycine max]
MKACNGTFTKAIGVELDLSDKPVGLGVRSRRYALLAEDGVVKLFNLEEGGAFTFRTSSTFFEIIVILLLPLFNRVGVLLITWMGYYNNFLGWC